VRNAARNLTQWTCIFRGSAWLYKGITLEYVTEAQRAFERGLALYPGNADFLVAAAAVDVSKALNALVDDRAAPLAAAERTLTKALLITPDHVYGHLFLGLVFSGTNRATQGIAEFERALTLNRNLALAHGVIGYAKFLLGRGAETEDHVNAALRLSPTDAFAY
jgi:tetratricopeptide (TPR) repeat protein